MTSIDQARTLLAEGNATGALAAAEKGKGDDAVASLCWVGEAKIASGDYEGALTSAREAEKEASKKKNKLGEAGAKLVTAKATLCRDGPAEAREGLAVLRGLGATWGECAGVFSIVEHTSTANDLDKGSMDAARRLMRCRDADDKLGEATELLALANIHMKKKGKTTALDAIGGAVNMFRELGVTWGEELVPFTLAEQRLNSDKPEAVLAMGKSFLEAASGAKAEAAANMVVAISSFASGDLQGAAKASDEAFEKFKKASSKEGQGAANQSRAECSLAQDERDDAMRSAKEAVATFKGLSHKRGHIGALFTLSKIHVQAGDPREALKAVEEALDLARELGDRRLEGSALHMLADAHMDIFQQEKADRNASAEDSSDVAKAVDLAEESLKLARASGDTRGVAASMHAMGNAIMLKGHYQDAVEFALKAATISRMVNYKLGEAHAMLSATKAQLAAGLDADGCVVGAEAALKSFREMKDKHAERAALQALTDAYAARDGYDAALQQVSRSQLAYFKKTGDKRGQASMMQTLAHLHFKGNQGGEHEAAMQKMAADALAIFQGLGDKKEEALSLQTVAEGQLRKGDRMEALKSAKEALQMQRDLGEKDEGPKRVEIQMLNTVYSVHMADGSHEEAVAAAKSAQEVCASIGDKSGQAHEIHLQVAAHLEQKDGDAAVAAAKEALDLWEDIGADGRFGHAVALHDAISAYLVTKRDSASKEQRQAMEYAAKALEAFRELDDRTGEAAILHAIAQLQVTATGSRSDAFQAAEDSNCVSMVMSNASADRHFSDKENDFTFKAAMQAVVLARHNGDKIREAGALHTVAQMYQAGEAVDQARTAAMRAQTAYAEVGDRAGVVSVQKLIDSLKDGPRRQPMTMMRYTPAPFAYGGGRGDLFTDPAQTVIWSETLGDTCENQPGISFCLSLLAFLNEVTKTSSKTKLIIATRGIMQRENGDICAMTRQGFMGNSAWACLRTVKLELPRLHVSSVDIPTYATPNDIVKCFSAVQNSPDLGNEITFRVENKKK